MGVEPTNGGFANRCLSHLATAPTLPQIKECRCSGQEDLRVVGEIMLPTAHADWKIARDWLAAGTFDCPWHRLPSRSERKRVAQLCRAMLSRLDFVDKDDSVPTTRSSRMGLFNWNFRSGDEEQLQGLAVRIVQRSLSEVLQRVTGLTSQMSPAEARGYIRTRGQGRQSGNRCGLRCRSTVPASGSCDAAVPGDRLAGRGRRRAAADGPPHDGGVATAAGSSGGRGRTQDGSARPFLFRIKHQPRGGRGEGFDANVVAAGLEMWRDRQSQRGRRGSRRHRVR